MSGNTLQRERYLANNAGHTEIPDVADAGTLDAKGVSGGYIALINDATGGATRTLADPTSSNQRLMIFYKDEGDAGTSIVITCDSAITEAVSLTMAFTDVGEFIDLVSVEDVAGAFAWRLVGSDGVTGPTATLGGVTYGGLASLDGNQMTAGTGVTTGSGTICVSSCFTTGGLIKTAVVLDLTGLRATAADDVIGVDGTALACHLGQFTAARSGTAVYASVTCLETPAGGDPDVNLFASSSAAGVMDTTASGLAGTGILLNHGDWTGAIATPILCTGVPAANEYFYVAAGATTDAIYTAGVFLIEIYGTA
jgi:hypothetical protein